MEIPKVWKGVLYTVSVIALVFLILSIAVWVKGGKVSDIIGWGREKPTEELIENYEVKKEVVSEQENFHVTGEVLPEDKGTIYQNYITKMPTEIEDGFYILYSPTMLDIEHLKETLTGYLTLEDAYPVHTFYLPNEESGVLGYQFYADVSGNEFTMDAPTFFFVKGGKFVESYSMEVKGTTLPVTSGGGSND